MEQAQTVAGTESRTNPTDDEYLTSTAVRRTFGGISDMTLWRWSHDLGFPKPDLVVNGRKFWLRATIKAWKPRREGDGQ